MKITKEQLRKIIKEELGKNPALKEAATVKLPYQFFLCNFGKGNKYALAYGTNGTTRMKTGDVVKRGKELESLASKYNNELEIHTTGDDTYVTEYKGLVLVMYDIQSDLTPDEISKVIGGKLMHMF